MNRASGAHSTDSKATNSWKDINLRGRSRQSQGRWGADTGTDARGGENGRNRRPKQSSSEHGDRLSTARTESTTHTVSDTAGRRTWRHPERSITTDPTHHRGFRRDSVCRLRAGSRDQSLDAVRGPRYSKQGSLLAQCSGDPEWTQGAGQPCASRASPPPLSLTGQWSRATAAPAKGQRPDLPVRV